MQVRHERLRITVRGFFEVNPELIASVGIKTENELCEKKVYPFHSFLDDGHCSNIFGHINSI